MAKRTCPSCGLNHEVNCGEALNLTMSEKIEVLLVAVVGLKWEKEIQSSTN